MTLYQSHNPSRRLRNVAGFRIRNGGGRRLLNKGFRDNANAHVDYVGDGILDTFSIPFYYKTAADLIVCVWDSTTKKWVVQVNGTDYVITGTQVVFQTASIPPAPTAPLTHSVEIWRQTPRNVEPKFLPSLHHGVGNIPNHPTRNYETAGIFAQELEDQVVGMPDVWTLNAWVLNLTTVPLRKDGLSMTLLPMGVPVPSTFDRASVTIQHGDVGVLPSDWNLRFWVRHTIGGAFTQMAKKPVDFSGDAILKPTTYHGRWLDVTTGLPTEVHVDPGHVFYVDFAGSIFDNLLGRVTLNRRARIPL